MEIVLTSERTAYASAKVSAYAYFFYFIAQNMPTSFQFQIRSIAFLAQVLSAFEAFPDPLDHLHTETAADLPFSLPKAF